MKEVRKNIPKQIRGKYNFGYCQADIEGLGKSEYFAHSSIQSEIPSVKGSGISIKDESSIFKAMSVNGDNIVNGAGAWPRDVDTEFKMLSEIQKRLGNNFDARGSIKLYTELEPCPSCQNVIEQFKKMYHNIDIEVIYEVKK